MIAATAVIAMMIFGAEAFAYRGAANCPFNAAADTPGTVAGGSGCPMAANLSDEQIQKADQARKAFFAETQELRQNIYQKGLELETAIAKKEPDVENIKKLQKDLSDLESQFDEKRIEHILLMKKISPSLGAGCGSRGGCGNCPMANSSAGCGRGRMHGGCSRN
ncbi:MAG: hypothetical protein BWK80_31735 [Desulfobacteraceae bacterium IS3]|nr:MAG: hypothetical protein BWK80_31735 [Desulfobacteraceae bacterium IS3]